jgi:hypothetical protein
VSDLDDLIIDAFEERTPYPEPVFRTVSEAWGIDRHGYINAYSDQSTPIFFDIVQSHNDAVMSRLVEEFGVENEPRTW